MEGQAGKKRETPTAPYREVFTQMQANGYVLRPEDSAAMNNCSKNFMLQYAKAAGGAALGIFVAFRMVPALKRLHPLVRTLSMLGGMMGAGSYSVSLNEPLRCVKEGMRVSSPLGVALRRTAKAYDPRLYEGLPDMLKREVEEEEAREKRPRDVFSFDKVLGEDNDERDTSDAGEVNSQSRSRGDEHDYRRPKWREEFARGEGGARGAQGDKAAPEDDMGERRRYFENAGPSSTAATRF